MRRIVLLLAIAALLGSTVATVDAAGASHGVRARAVKMRLHRFSSCKRLVKYARSRAPREIRYAAGPVVAPGTPPAFAQTDDTPSRGGDNAGAEGAPSAAPTPADPGSDTSGTNVQEQGVDKPDIVKTDGRTIFAISNG